MSVALPVAAVVFGSVTPPQGDIVDLWVHLGSTKEISSFECTLQNWDKKYSIGGTYPIVEGSVATISAGRDSNCPLLLTGKVEETDPESRAVEHYIIIRGRCNGEQLFRRLVTKSWANVKGEVVVKYVIDNYTSLSHVRNSVELIEDTDTTYTYLEYDDTPVFDIIKYIAETADKAGAIGFNFRIAPDGKFEFFPKNSKTSPVDLSERLEFGNPKRSITRIKNRIKVYGAVGVATPSDIGKTEPSDGDSWTENSLDGWTTDGGSDQVLSLGTTVPKVGLKYVVCTANIPPYIINFKKSISNIGVMGNRGYKKITFYHKSVASAIILRLYAPDASNYFEHTFATNVASWNLKSLQLGKDQEYDADKNPNGPWTKVGSADWENLGYVAFYATYGIVSFSVSIDGLHFGEGRWRATRPLPAEEPTASQTAYGLREKAEVDEELKSDTECDYRARALLDFFENLITTPKVRSTVIDYGTTPILASDKTHITLPNENVDDDYPIISAEYRLNGENQTLEVELDLAKEPLLYADFIYGFRKAIQKLDKYKSGR